MRYLLLIRTEESDDAAIDAASPEERAGRLAAYDTLIEELDQRGVWLGGERLTPTGESALVQVRDGQTLKSDGPYAETKEQVGGFFLVDCKDLDDAVEIAARIPAAQRGTIEVRAIWER